MGKWVGKSILKGYWEHSNFDHYLKFFSFREHCRCCPYDLKIYVTGLFCFFFFFSSAFCVLLIKCIYLMKCKPKRYLLEIVYLFLLFFLPASTHKCVIISLHGEFQKGPSHTLFSESFPYGKYNKQTWWVCKIWQVLHRFYCFT